jgi:hypothetical protein
MKASAQSTFLVVLSALAFAITVTILAFYAPRDYGLFQLAGSLRLGEKAAIAAGLLLALVSALLRLSSSTASGAKRRRRYIALLHLFVGAAGLGGGIWILIESYATIANLRFDVTALHYAALSLVLSIIAISFAASLALVTRRSE